MTDNVLPFRGQHQASRIADKILAEEFEHEIINAKNLFEARQKTADLMKGCTPLDKLFGAPILESGFLQQIEQRDWRKNDE